MTDKSSPSNIQFFQCASLVAKVMIAEDHVYTHAEIELARELMQYRWNLNVGDFLRVIAGITVPRDEPISEAYAALVYPLNRS